MRRWTTNDRASCWDLIDLARMIHSRSEDFSEGDLLKRIKRFGVYVLQEVSVLDMHRDMYDLDEDDVKEYAEKSLETMPPIILGEKFGLMFDNTTEKHDIVDGNHRLESHILRGEHTIKAFVPIEETRINENDEDDEEE